MVRKQDNLQDLSEQTTRLTCDQDWTVAGDRNKGIAPSDDPNHGALHTGRKILGRLEVSSDSPTKLRGFWNKVSRIPVKRYSDDQGSQVETEKAEREGEDEKIVKGEAEPIPAPDGGPSAVDKVLPHSQASRLPPVPTLVEPSAGTTASSSTPKIDAASAKDSVTDRGTSSSLGLGDLEASKSKETPKNMCCLLPDNAEEELVQRLKRKMLSSKFDRSSINSSRIKTPTPIPLARRKSWLSEPKAETSHDPLLGAKIPSYASGAAPEDEKCDAKAIRKARLRTERIERLKGKESSSSMPQSLQPKTTPGKSTDNEVSPERSIEIQSAKEAARDTGSRALTMEREAEISKKRSADAGETGLVKSALDAGERLARLRRRLQHSLEYLKQQQVGDRKAVGDREETMTKEANETLMPPPQREPAFPRGDALQLETPAVKTVENNFTSIFPVNRKLERSSKTVVAEEKVCELESSAALLTLPKQDDPTKLERKLSRSALQKQSSHRRKETFPFTDGKAGNASPERETMATFSVSQRWDHLQHRRKGRGRSREMKETFLPSEASDSDKKKPNEFTPVANADDSEARDETRTSEVQISKSVRSNLPTELGVSPNISEAAISKTGTKSFSREEICSEKVAGKENVWQTPKLESGENAVLTSASQGFSEKNKVPVEKQNKRREAMKMRRKENQDLPQSECAQSNISNPDTVLCQPPKDLGANGESENVQEEAKDAPKTWSNEQNLPAQENPVKNDNLKETNELCSTQSEEQTPMKELTQTPSKDSSSPSKARRFQPDGTRALSELSTNSLFTSKRNLYQPSQQEQEGINQVDSTFPRFTADHEHVLDETDGSQDCVDWKREGDITIRRRVRWRRLAERQDTVKIPPPVPPKICRRVARSPTDTVPNSLLPFSAEIPPQIHKSAENMPEVLLVKPSVGTALEDNLKEENKNAFPAEVESQPFSKESKPPKPQVSPKPAKGTYISTIRNTTASEEGGESKGGANRVEICEEKFPSPKEASSIFKAKIEMSEQAFVREAKGEGAAHKTSRHNFKETLQKFQKHIREGDKPPSPEHACKAKNNLGTSMKFELEGKS